MAPRSCPHETYINLEWDRRDTPGAEAFVWVAACNGNQYENCRFRFVYTDEDGDTLSPNEPLMITSGEMATWVGHHRRWSSLPERERTQYAAQQALTVPAA